MSLRVTPRVCLTVLFTLAMQLAGPARAIAQATGPGAWRPLETVGVFVGLDGSKQPQDLGINANMGPRLAVDWGVPLSKRQGLGIQLGAAVNVSDAAVHVLDQIDGTSSRTQTFLTAGLFQRTGRLVWGVAYDGLWQQYYDRVTLGQVRAEAAVRVSPRLEVGAWGAHGVRGADAAVGETALRLNAISQGSGFLRQEWPTGARTTAWLGVAAGHHNVVLVFPDDSRSGPVAVYGADLYMPLNDRFAVTGAANLITPTATGTVDAYMGVVFHFRGGARAASAARQLPLMPVANNTTFSVDLHR